MNTSRISRPARALALTLSLTALAFSSGCLAVVAGAGAGAGTVAYVRGELDATLESTFDQATKATAQAIQQLQYAQISERKDALVANLVVRNADDKKIKIRIERIGDKLAKVSIRVGTFGDESLSQVILGKIKAGL